MNLKPVVSSNITHIGYDPATKELGVKFKSGKLYKYHPVTLEDYTELINADSIGGYFANHIKNKEGISYERID